MGTKTYLPTKEDQIATNAKIAALQEAVDRLEANAGIQYANVTIRLNWEGSTYEVPTDETEKSEILKGAKFVLKVNGVDAAHETPITSLENCSATFRVLVTDAARVGASFAGVALGKSKTCAYAVAAQQVYLQGGTETTISLVSKKVTIDEGDTVELFRVQPYVANPSAAINERLKAGNSYLGIRVTNASGTTTRLGHWTQEQASWVDESLVKVSLWDIPKNSDGTPGTPVERVISDIDSSTSENWQPIEEYLDCLKNIKVGTVTFKNGDTAIAGENKMVRYDKLYVKSTFEKVNMPIMLADGTLADNEVDCVVKWYANKPLDGYHLHPLFIKYTRCADGTYSEEECAHGYIARYPVGNTVNTTLDGTTKIIPIWKSGTGAVYTMGQRSVCVANFRNLNKLTATMTFDGEDAVTIPPDDTNRTWGGCGTAEISFLQNLAYLYFGVNVQGAASPTDYTKNVFPGICMNSASPTTNGATDFVLAAGKVNGAVDTSSPLNSICFLGVEDALWSSTGWDWNDLTLVTRRVMTANADGSLASDVVTTSFLFCQDSSLVLPDEGKDISNETTIDEAQSFEGRLKAIGYRETEFDVGTGTNYRRGLDTSSVLRDAGLPAGVQDQHNLNIGNCDWFARGSTPSDFAFSASAAYEVGAYVKYSNAVYKCTAAHPAGAWDAAHFTLVAGDAQTVVTRRSYCRVSLGIDRGNGASLGAFTVLAINGLTVASGSYWRARPLLRRVS